MFKIGQNK